MLTRRMLPPPLTAASSPLRLARPPSTSAGCVGMGGRRWSKNKTSVPLYIAVVVLWQPRTVTVPALSPLGCRNSLEVLSPRPTQLCRTTTSSSSASAAPSTMKRYGYGDGASNTRVYTRGSPRQPKRRRATSEHGNGEGGGTRRDGAHGNPLFASRRNFHNTAENKQASSSTSSSSSSSSSTDGAASASTSLPVYEQLADMWADLCMLELEEAILATFTAKPPTTTATSSIDTTPTATTSAADGHASSTDATSEATSPPPPTTSEASCSSSTIDASIALVKSQYRLLVRQHHPDVDGGDSAVMERINVAYERLERSEAAEWAALQSWVCSPDFQAHNHVEMSAAQIYGYRAVARGSSDIIFAGLACTITWAAIIFSSYYWYSTTPGLSSNATTSTTTTAAATTTSAATMEAAGSLSANASSVLAQRWWGMVHGSSSNHHNTNTSTHPSQHHARDVVMNVPPRQRAYISEVRSTTSILTAFYLVMTHCAAIFLVV